MKKTIAHVQSKIQNELANVHKSKNNNLGAQLKKVMLNMLINNMQVAEIYNPPRVVEMANKMGLRGGWILDLTTNEDDGVPGDFNDSRMRNRAIRKILQDKPLVLIGSSTCTAYNSMNRINYSKIPREEMNARLAHARKHLEFCIQLYKIQWRNGRYFVHEHPEGASSWDEALMKRLMNKQGVHRVVGDQCQYGLRSTDEKGEAPARKRTRFFTNAMCGPKIESKMPQQTKPPSASTCRVGRWKKKSNPNLPKQTLQRNLRWYTRANSKGS